MVGASRADVERAAGITEPSADINCIEIAVHGWSIPCPRAISKMRISKHAEPFTAGRCSCGQHTLGELLLVGLSSSGSDETDWQLGF